MPQAIIAAASWIASEVAFAAVGAGMSMTAAAAVGFTTLGVTAAGIGYGLIELSQVLTPRLSQAEGASVDWKANPRAGIPYAFGRTGTGGNIIFQRSAGEKSKYLNFVTVYTGAGPIEGYESTSFNDVAVSFTSDGGEGATGYYRNRMWLTSSLGGHPDTFLHWSATGSKDTPANHGGQPAEWTATHVMSGFASDMVAFEYDPAVYSSGPPKKLRVGKWVKVYDPRKDSTYPGGSGPHRALNEATYEWSENPYLHALTWALGRWQNGKRVLGLGAPIATIDVGAFVEGANVADANGWKCGGVAYSTDDKYEVFKAFLQAGGGKPLKLAARLSCVVTTPRVSLAVLTQADVVGDVTVTGGQGRRQRINTIWPRYREEAQAWQLVAQDAPVTVAAYYPVDGGQRSKEIEYAYVQSATQAAQLARYDIENMRELGPATFPCKPIWSGYKPGDCITVTEPEYGLNNQKMLIVGRQTNPATMMVTLTCMSETDGKHGFALGQTGTPPATPALTGVDPGAIPAPAASVWAAVGGTVSNSGQSLPAIIITSGADGSYYDNANAISVIVEYQLAGSGVWQSGVEAPAQQSTQTITLTGMAPGSSYFVGLRYRTVRGITSVNRLVLGPVTTGGVAAGGIVDGGGNTVPGNVVLQPGVNLVYDGAFRLSGARWTLGPNWEFSPTDGTGLALMGANGTSVSTSDNFNVKPNTTYTIQAEVLAYGIVSGAVMANVQWHDAGGAVISQSNGLYWGNGGFTDWRRQATQVTSPANAAYGRARIYTSSVVWATSLSAAVFRRVKVAAETSASPFSDDATNGAVYNDGRDINSLRPAQAGADKTASNTAAAILNQGQLATSTLTTTQVDNRNVPVGANALINDLFSNGTYGWETGGDGSTGKTFDKGLNYPGYGGQRNVAYCHVVGAVAANAWFWGLYSSGAVGALSSRPRFALPVVAGDLVYIRCLMAYHRCKGVLRVRWMDGAGNNILEQDIVPNLASGDAGGPNGANGDPGNFGEVWGYFTAPANARYAALLTYAQVLTATNDPFLFVAEPMLAKAPAGQNTSVKLPYLPGTVDRYADQTGINQSASIAGQGALATKNQAASADLAVGIGGNLLFGADHQLDPALIYQIGWNPSNASYTIQRASDYYGGSWSLADRSTFTLSQLDNTTDGGSGFNIIDVYLYRPDGVGGFTNKWSVQPGKWYEFSAYFTSWAQVNCYCGIAWFDKNWAQLYGEVGASVAGNTGNGRDMGADYQRAFVRKQAPPGAVMAMPFIRKSNYPGGSWMMWTHPKFCETVANATEISPWSPSVWSVGVYQSSRGRIINANGLPINGMTSYGWVINPTAPLSSPSSTSINVAPFTLYLPGYSLSVSSAPINGLAPNTAYSVYWDLQASTFVAISSGTQPYSTSPDRYIALGVQTTQQASGGWSPPSPPVGGGGGGGGGICVLADSHMPNRIRAGAVQAGTALTVLKRDGSGHEPEVCYSNRPGAQPCVMLTLANGAQVGCTVKTPIEQRDGSAIFAQHALGAAAAYLVDGVFGWAEIVAVEPIGVRPIAQITVGNRSYAAGVKPGAFVFTHNQSQIP